MKNIIKIKKETENLTELIYDILENLPENCENVIEFEKGTYHFYRKGSKKIQLFSSGGLSVENYVVFPIIEKKNLTILCHPQWSNTSAKYFETQKGNFGMEIWNSGCALAEDCDADAAYWDELLGQGKVIYGVATDDSHVFDHLCKGWVMVKANKDLNEILSALEKGEFYSSCGPEIYDFYVEDDKAVIDCSPVARVRLHSDMHPNQVRVDENGNITHAEFTLNHWAGPYDYVRASIIDKEGKQAWTNPIFLDGREG